MAKKDLSSGVVVANPCKVLVAYQAALALQEAGFLQHYETGFYYKSKSFFLSIFLAALPSPMALAMRKEMSRRVQEGVSSDLVRTHGTLDILFYLTRKLGFSSFIVDWVRRQRNAWFDVATAHTIRACHPKAVIAFDGNARKTFEACNQVGAVKILHQVIGDVRSYLEICEEENRLCPDFQSVIPRVSERIVNSCMEEIETAGRILVPSAYVRETLVKYGASPLKIEVLPYGVNTKQFKPDKEKLDDGVFRILFVGEIGPRKGVKYLLEAFKRLHLKDAELVLMGNIAVRDDALTQYKGYFKHVCSVPYSELPMHYQGADIFVFPSLHEGSALVTYEALASGLPVITTHNSGSIVRDGEDGFIVPIRDVEALMKKIHLLHQDKDLREIMGSKARQHALDFTWRAHRQKLSVLINEIYLRHDEKPLLKNLG